MIIRSESVIREELKEIRQAILSGNISYSQLRLLKDLSEYIDRSYALLLEWAGVPENIK